MLHDRLLYQTVVAGKATENLLERQEPQSYVTQSQR